MPSLLACLQVNHEDMQETAQKGKKRKTAYKNNKKKSKKKRVVRITASSSEKHAGRVGVDSSGKGSLLEVDGSSSISLLTPHSAGEVSSHAAQRVEKGAWTKTEKDVIMVLQTNLDGANTRTPCREPCVCEDAHYLRCSPS